MDMLDRAGILLVASAKAKNWSRSDVSLAIPIASAWLGQEPCTFITTRAPL